MLKRMIPVLVALALALGSAAWAAKEGNNALSSDDTSRTVTFTGAKGSVVYTNDGASPVWIYVWDGTETAATITTAKSGARKVNPGETFGFEWEGGADGGIGYVAFTHICAAATTTTGRWIAK